MLKESQTTEAELDRGNAGSSALLRAFLEAGDACQAEAALGELMQKAAEPLISAIVYSKLARSGPANTADVEDVSADTSVAVISRLQELRKSPASGPLEDFDAFVAVIAYRACSAHYRQMRPAFYRLRNRLRYLLETQADLAIWEDAQGEWWCGFARWQPEPGRPVPAPVSREDIQTSGIEPSANPAHVVAEVFRRAGGPARFDTLVRTMARLWDVREASAAPVSDDLPVAIPAPSAERTLQRRQWVARLWGEIAELPAKQRAAVLLNLRDENGESVTTLFTVTRVVDLDRLAAAVEMSTEEFAAIWKDLPWSDMQIAARLASTRQQVINLRKSARERLCRRMFGGGAVEKGAW